MLNFLEQAHGFQVLVIKQAFHRVHRGHRDVIGTQHLGPLRIAALWQMGLQVLAHGFCVLGARFLVQKARIAVQQVGLTDQLGESAPVLVGVDHQRQVTVLCGVGATGARHQALVFHRPLGRREGRSTKVIAQNKLRHGFEHRHFDFLPLARALAVHQRGQDGRGDVQTHHPIANIDRCVARRSIDFAKET